MAMKPYSKPEEHPEYGTMLLQTIPEKSLVPSDLLYSVSLHTELGLLVLLAQHPKPGFAVPSPWWNHFDRCTASVKELRSFLFHPIKMMLYTYTALFQEAFVLIWIIGAVRMEIVTEKQCFVRIWKENTITKLVATISQDSLTRG